MSKLTTALAAIGYTEHEIECVRSLHWKMAFHLNCSDGNTLVHEVPALGMTRRTFTPKTGRGVKYGYGDPGPSTTTFYLKDEEETFPSIVDALKVLREKHYGIIKNLTEANVEATDKNPNSGT